jgi:DNA-binding response OmpR family regulator
MPKKILFIDDNPDLIEVVALRLNKSGYEALIALSGEEGLSLAQAKPPDLIFLDFKLPVMDGIEVSKHLKKHEHLKKVPVVLFTSSTDRVEEIARLMQADDYIAKPFEAGQLMEKIKKFLG